MKKCYRIEKIPHYIFSKFDNIKKDLKQKGIEIIDLGIGDPDIPTPKFIVDSMVEFLKIKDNFRYPPYRGIEEFKVAVSNYYKKKYNVELDYNTEVVALIGSKEGIAHLFLALTDPKDYVLLPDPSYPVYQAAALIAGCEIYRMPLYEENNFIPDINEIDKQVARKAKLLVVNYPNNPTGALANEEFYNELIEFGLNNDIAIVNDGAYLDIYKNKKPISILQIPRAKEIAIEFGSLSKSFNMTGWRLGYAVGCSEILNKLMVIKTNFDSGQFNAIQQVGALALNTGDNFTKYINDIYKERRIIVVEKLRKKGIHVYDSEGTFYVWFKVPKEYSSVEYSEKILKEAGVLITPGSAFGIYGEGYCRISLTIDLSKLKEAMDRIVTIKP
ncbi:aminotransferase class I/II-fold pyridoxal phosphate-dependent enzyme [Caloramator sp. E03]|uniref:LL-diaminopimelate aminotransferase n=1 Tax=Caloramator sp. E03 TaxID=2576307 RepID=UPI00111085AF|nr:LL-diaminopimelate aminotransferase [Caloramator sp. E03]QCX32209.1 aminotransferase class I/II-fold pyridoxal phosphate-dependent enzyme [Caloramator sp. E03]